MTDVEIIAATTVEPLDLLKAEKIANQPRNVEWRITTLAILVIVGVAGNAMVFAWIFVEKRVMKKRNRLQSLIINVAASDALVVCAANLPQIILEAVQYRWIMGTILCKLMRSVQIFAILASNNMLIVLAVDRHRAVVRPLKEPTRVSILTGIGWLMAVLMAFPCLFVFETYPKNFQAENPTVNNNNNDNNSWNFSNSTRIEDSNAELATVCSSIFRRVPTWIRMVWVVYAMFVSFIAPSLLLLSFYVHIFLKICQKTLNKSLKKKPQNRKENDDSDVSENDDASAEMTTPEKMSQKMKISSQMKLNASDTTTLRRARNKTLVMTIVIVGVFVLLGIPNFVLEVLMSFQFKKIDDRVYAVFGALAAANSSINPFIFLIFTANIREAWERAKRQRSGGKRSSDGDDAKGVNRGTISNHHSAPVNSLNSINSTKGFNSQKFSRTPSSGRTRTTMI